MKKKTTQLISLNLKFKGMLQSQQLPVQLCSDLGFETNSGPFAHPHGRTALHLAGPLVTTGFARGFATGFSLVLRFQALLPWLWDTGRGALAHGAAGAPCTPVPLCFIYSKDKLFPYFFFPEFQQN